ncbi:hypothetical protein CHS0354_015238 [Potamilus streckersoni]|uniref:Uncharacterized protein n=1 Tax=Potamilus streckersoni TaxID=2493646 RepID=A0AAE0VHK9_9BIVA|nr:hypothetical protein CHS0354_015238 [Potamilus streckersoni]
MLPSFVRTAHTPYNYLNLAQSVNEIMRTEVIRMTPEIKASKIGKDGGRLNGLITQKNILVTKRLQIGSSRWRKTLMSITDEPLSDPAPGT